MQFLNHAIAIICFNQSSRTKKIGVRIRLRFAACFVAAQLVNDAETGMRTMEKFIGSIAAPTLLFALIGTVCRHCHGRLIVTLATLQSDLTVARHASCRDDKKGDLQ
ncbi:hypothetical protein [Collimonas arenae]|uniref:hypothetical protein n=1 Tax=Collimonas arenae TaxID=279058 RepID=UPI0005700B12|nr:hypothetical protein [Collimonas arenae]